MRYDEPLGVPLKRLKTISEYAAIRGYDCTSGVSPETYLIKRMQAMEAALREIAADNLSLWAAKARRALESKP
jgi:hypothetical protein